jgi:ZIP family zinc transporter
VEISNKTYMFALAVSTIAGMATMLGSFIAFFVKKTNTKALCYTLSFSAGAMLFLSFADLLPASFKGLRFFLGPQKAALYSALALFCGIGFILLIDKVLLKKTDPHASFPHKEMPDTHVTLHHTRMKNLSLITTLAIAIHNFPEGLATFISALQGTGLGLSVAVAIALHNIPEGISVSIPIYYATGSKLKAIGVTFLAALAEPIGAIIGFAIMKTLIPVPLHAIMVAFVAGIMIFISFDELLPTSRAYGGSKEVILGVVLGMGFMALGHLLSIGI